MLRLDCRSKANLFMKLLLLASMSCVIVFVQAESLSQYLREK
ncbi:MAG TPA: hypothetical protein VFY34_00880 [Pyrinomonadaceae bacterium]|nr:hypothetical protein [Pyrinomonadaceae bacterium]